jgi:hypothetical protein
MSPNQLNAYTNMPICRKKAPWGPTLYEWLGPGPVLGWRRALYQRGYRNLIMHVPAGPTI